MNECLDEMKPGIFSKLVSIRVCNLVWLDLIKGVCWAFVEVFAQRGAILVLSVPLSFQLCC